MASSEDGKGRRYPGKSRGALLAEDAKAALRHEIRGRGVSQRDLARSLGRGDSYLANLFMEIPGRAPVQLRLDTLFDLLFFLDVDPLAFVGRLLAHRPAAWPLEGAPGHRVNGSAAAVGIIRELVRDGEALDEIPGELIQQAIDDALSLVSRLTRRMGQRSGQKKD